MLGLTVYYDYYKPIIGLTVCYGYYKPIISLTLCVGYKGTKLVLIYNNKGY
jgi:hypothetical protein